MKMISADTYEELYEILSLMDKATVMKVPINILNNIKEQRNPKHQTRIDPKDIFNEDNVNKETIDLLCYLDYHYWMDEDKKAEVDRIRKERFIKEEEEKSKQYNSEDLFKNNKKEENDNTANVALIDYKISIFTRIKNFVLNMLHIKK
jgi:hypothetical protein